ncbi:MAG: hypothetical protein KDE15_13765 [Erythrobacter sp.]|nr:hypothetical protein [Erythrobacter sp.]
MKAAALALAMALGLPSAPAMAQDEAPSRAEQFAQLPYFPGYWVSLGQEGTTITGLAPALTDNPNVDINAIMPLRANLAAWNEEGQRRVAEVRAAAGGRKALGWGFPMMMNCATPFQILITPEEVLISNAYNETRHIYTDGRPMPDELDMWPTTWGTSVGHWEGNVLVIETAMVKDPSLFFHGAPPFSEEARYVERIHIDGDRLISEFTVTDPVTLNEPYHATVTYVRDQGFDRMIQVDWDNDRTGNDGEFNTIEATAVGD